MTLDMEKAKKMYELLLKSNPTTVFYDDGGKGRCWSNTASLYFFYLGNYDRFEHQDKERIYEYLSLIVRVEKEIDGQSYTIWTKEDGEIEAFKHPVFIKGKYYSIRELDLIIEEFNRLKSNI